VWWLGRKRSAALDDGATGGIIAIILRAHTIAAAKVRLQSRKSKFETREPARSRRIAHMDSLEHPRAFLLRGTQIQLLPFSQNFRPTQVMEQRRLLGTV